MNRAIRRHVVEWAERNGYVPEEREVLAAAPPGVVKEWIRRKGFDPNDFANGVPSGPRPGQAPAPSPAPAGTAAPPSGAAGRPNPQGSPPGAVAGGAQGNGSGGGTGGGGGAAAANPPGPSWASGAWCTPELQAQIQAVLDQQGAHRDERSLLSGGPATVTALGKRAAPGQPKKGTNTTHLVELDNGVTGFHKPFGGEKKSLERAFGQDSAQQSLHEAAAWRLASQMGPPWSEIVPPVVLREINGQMGSFALERPGKLGERDPWQTGEWQEAGFFDALIGQQDRHPNNYLVAGDRIALIDHGYTFATNGDYLNFSWLAWERVNQAPALTYQERSVLQRLVSSPDLLGMAKIVQPARAQALRARAEDMLKSGQVQIPF